MKILYLIPARGGSKGLPQKNVKPLAGKPLIAYSIEAALTSSCKGVVIVSTDDEKIAAVSKQYGADVPFIRPAELATDTASTNDVIIHALNYYKNKNIIFDSVVILQPTSPLRISADIENSINLLNQKKSEAVVSVCENEHPSYWSNVLPEDGSMKNFIREDVKGKNRQQLATTYRLNGAIYVSKVDAFIRRKEFVHDAAYAYIMPKERSVDIDNEIDFKLAEILMQKN